MQISPDDLRPLLRAHYLSPEAMWVALGKLMPTVALIVGRQVGRDERRERTSDVLVELAGRVERQRGLVPNAVPEDKLGAWFRVCVSNCLRDVRRRLNRDAARTDELPDTLEDPAVTPEVVLDADANAAAHALWDALAAPDCPPAYRLALYVWYVPARMRRRDLEALAERAQRGKTDQAAGVVRPVERAWPLLRQIAARYPDGVARKRRGIDSFAFSVRSDAAKFTVWAADRDALSAARETVGKWHTRGRRWLDVKRRSGGGEAGSR